jgi:glucosylceramidase
MQVDMEDDENKPLVGIANDAGKRREQRCWNCKAQFLGLVLLVIGVVVFYPDAKPTSTTGITGISARGDEQKEAAPPQPPQPTGVPPVMYRPFCLTHGKATTARILQTSMGSPSQQWSHIPCYSQPEKVRRWASSQKPNVNLNKYGAPDAILKTSLSKTAFPTRTPILGFGAAFTEAAMVNYQSLSKQGKETLMELLYGTSGLGYALGRVPINSCDFSIQSYSFDDTDGDFELEDFDTNVTHDAQKDGMIDMILRATSVFNTDWKSDDGMDGIFKMYASPWSPPAWMKAPTWSDPKGSVHAATMTGSAQPSCLREGTVKGSRYAKSWALYFSKFITACKYNALLSFSRLGSSYSLLPCLPYHDSSQTAKKAFPSGPSRYRTNRNFQPRGRPAATHPKLRPTL